VSPRRPRAKSSGEQERIDEARGVFMISVAAELAGVHPQTLRMYEARGLISPKRSPKQTRLYSQRDVELLRRIQQMTTQDGLNLAGVELVLDMERKVNEMRNEVARMRRRAEEMERQMLAEVEQVRRSLRAEIVPYGAYEPAPPPAARAAEAEAPVKISVQRPSRGQRR
jgi:MerR family transcriptional regulator/heat shock protein HspR